METSSDHNNHLKPSISQEKQLIPLKAIISLVTFIRDNKPGITLTWDVKMSSDNISKLSRYNEFKNSNFQSLIKEYEIYGYKETKENSICKNNKPWQMVNEFNFITLSNYRFVNEAFFKRSDQWKIICRL